MIRLKQKFDPSTYVSYAYTASLFAPFSLPLPGASADSTYPDSLAYLAYLKLPSFSVDPSNVRVIKKLSLTHFTEYLPKFDTTCLKNNSDCQNS